MPPLIALGWSDEWQAKFDAVAPEGAVPARVCLEHNHVFRLAAEAGELLAETAGRIKHRAVGRHELPAVGDWVVVRPDPTGGRALIVAVLPRRTWFSRKAAGRETTEQVVAANIDVVWLVFGLDAAVNARAIERYLVVAERSGARPVVVLNKSDLVDDVGAAVAEATLAAGAAPVVAVSTKTGFGLDRLERDLRPGMTLALLGPSGAGKSSIVNQLIGREALLTGDVRDWDRRGRHTSVHRQLMMRESGGLIIDTPGMREVALWETAPVVDSFADIAALADACRFRDCRHDREPGCAVKAAVESGQLDAERHASFLKLQSEQQELADRRDERSLLEAKRQSKIQNKALKAMQKDRGR
ncbi:MAG TPA: ribosome small subunit-dependent GTPase A [Vicinamibacterales bacterium]|nr:ribosome small subunit-dependent GTPase A [Vicinamibacterales bacterium]